MERQSFNSYNTIIINHLKLVLFYIKMFIYPKDIDIEETEETLCLEKLKARIKLEYRRIFKQDTRRRNYAQRIELNWILKIYISNLINRNSNELDLSF